MGVAMMLSLDYQSRGRRAHQKKLKHPLKNQPVRQPRPSIVRHSGQKPYTDERPKNQQPINQPLADTWISPEAVELLVLHRNRKPINHQKRTPLTDRPECIHQPKRPSKTSQNLHQLPPLQNRSRKRQLPPPWAKQLHHQPSKKATGSLNYPCVL